MSVVDSSCGFVRGITANAAPASIGGQRAELIRRVNQLYHERTADAFDGDHGYRHRIEGRFWRRVGRELLAERGALRTGARPDSERSGLTIVDLACGTGFVGRTLHPFLRGSDRLIALDLGVSMLKLTRWRWPATGDGPPLCPLSGDAQRLPLADAGADLVTMNAGLHHLPDPGATLGEVDRILRPGGCFALGFEPNRGHFDSSTMRKLSRGMFLAGWYLNPRENLRRLRQHLAPALGTTRSTAVPDLFASINRSLIEEGMARMPLTEGELLDLVDPHARGGGRAAGFDPRDLLADLLPGYRLLRLTCSDWLGETARRYRGAAPLADAILALAMPGRGSLFCWVIRKPGGGVAR